MGKQKFEIIPIGVPLPPLKVFQNSEEPDSNSSLKFSRQFRLPGLELRFLQNTVDPEDTNIIRFKFYFRWHFLVTSQFLVKARGLSRRGQDRKPPTARRIQTFGMFRQQF